MNDESLRSLLASIADGRDANPAQLQRLRSEHPETGALIEQALDRFTRLRRREAQFAAVVALTHDLVARRDGSLLDSIVERAHELMGSDMTYISVYDGGTERFVVRAVRGESSPDFRGMIVPPGVGIATLVVQKMGPVWVDDYQGSHGFPHDEEIDRVLGAEQISSIMGVPLIANQHVLGVLFVAERRPRRYSPEEISLARSFADHAAIVIEQGKLVADLHAASARADVERRRAEATAAEIRRASSLHENLTTLVASGADPQTIADALAASLQRRIAVVDAHTTLLAGGPLLHESPEALPALRSAIQRRASVVLAEGKVEFIAPIVVRQLAVGALLVERSAHALTQADRRAVERSGIAFALLWMQREASEQAEERLRGELVQELVDARGDREPLLERVRARGLNPAGPWTVAHLVVEPGAADRVLQAVRAEGVLASGSTGALWLLIPGEDPLPGIHRALRRVGMPERLIVHQSGDSLPSLLEHIESVRGTYAFLASIGGVSRTVSAAEFAPYAVLFDGRGERAREFIDGAIQPLLEWDAQRGTGLFETLLASLDEQGSVVGIARRLAVHPNTVRQRLERISVLLPGDWTLPDARFRLEIAARLEAARRAIGT